jgi:CDP-glucose 4,6-dehydratase
VENVVIDPSFWRGRRVLVTGHTGFKGAWSVLLLASLGAEVHGYALPPEEENGLFRAARVSGSVQHRVGDIRDRQALAAAVAEIEPQVIIHMAAQSLVRTSYLMPVETYSTNVMGTVHLLEAVRGIPSVQAVVVVTSDKCYENPGSIWPYRETDPLGGHDPYSNSKACAELVTDAYRRSFFHEPNAARLATVRAGNVIGGGDWSQDRLVPDAMRAFVGGNTLWIRNPESVRPWQHVLDPIIGYLRLAQLLVLEGNAFSESWNFGPTPASALPVRHIVDTLVQLWGGSAAWEYDSAAHVHEAASLKLDCTKTAVRLGWDPVIGLDDALRMTIDWYRACHEGADLRRLTFGQIETALALVR